MLVVPVVEAGVGVLMSTASGLSSPGVASGLGPCTEDWSEVGVETSWCWPVGLGDVGMPADVTAIFISSPRAGLSITSGLSLDGSGCGVE